MKLKVDHAFIDVKTGRGLLRRALKKAGEEKGVPVILYGKLVEEHSGDDGESQEFRMEVTKCIVPPNDEWVTDFEKRAAANRARGIGKK